MAWVSAAAFVFVFIPAIIYAGMVARSPAAIYGAMFLPMLVLALIFSSRLAWNACRMFRGRHGTWNRVSAQSIPGSEIFMVTEDPVDTEVEDWVSVSSSDMSSSDPSEDQTL